MTLLWITNSRPDSRSAQADFTGVEKQDEWFSGVYGIYYDPDKPAIAD